MSEAIEKEAAPQLVENRTGRIVLTFADGHGKEEGGKYAFQLKIGQLRELQEKCDAGPPEIVERLALRRWRVDDVREPIRLGLMGAGMDASTALALVDRYVHDGTLADHAPLAQVIVLASMSGSRSEPTGKKKRKRKTVTTTDASTSQASTAPPSQPDSSAPDRQTN